MPSLPPDCSGARRAWSVKRATRAGGRRMAAEEFRGSASAALLVMFSEAAAHLIYAAADIVLVPSLFEPCGPPVHACTCGLRAAPAPLPGRAAPVAAAGGASRPACMCGYACAACVCVQGCACVSGPRVRAPGAG